MEWAEANRTRPMRRVRAPCCPGWRLGAVFATSVKVLEAAKLWPGGRGFASLGGVRPERTKLRIWCPNVFFWKNAKETR